MDRGAGQFDNEALHVDFCQPLAVSEPPPTDAMASLKEIAEPTTYALSVSKYDRGLGEGVNMAVGTGDGVVGEAVPTASAANSASIDIFVGGAVSTASAANSASRASKGAARVLHAA